MTTKEPILDVKGREAVNKRADSLTELFSCVGRHLETMPAEVVAAYEAARKSNTDLINEFRRCGIQL